VRDLLVQWKVKISRKCMYRALRWLGILWLSVMDEQGEVNNSNIAVLMTRFIIILKLVKIY
jgi:hypothetical protein